MELEDLKEYLRIDADITEDDVLITSLGEAAVSYLEQTTHHFSERNRSLI